MAEGTGSARRYYAVSITFKRGWTWAPVTSASFAPNSIATMRKVALVTPWVLGSPTPGTFWDLDMDATSGTKACSPPP